MGTERKQAQITRRPKRGRPSRDPDEARAKRVVTFLTNREMERLEQIAHEEERSLSAVVHRIIVKHLENIG